MAHVVLDTETLDLEPSRLGEEATPPGASAVLELSFFGFPASICSEYEVILVGDQKYKVFTAGGRNYYVLGSH